LKSKLLIIGGSGLVGSTLLQYATPNYDIHFTYNTNKITFDNTNSTQINLLDNQKKNLELIKEIRPDIVVNTAAQSSVDLCESDHENADKLHVKITQDITQVCKDIDSKLVYISTDAVFQGELNKRYTEIDSTNPVNYYGLTKLRAEQIILNSSKNNVVLRTAVVYGYHKKSRFTNWIIDSLRQSKNMELFVDQYNTPTLVDDLAKSIILILQKNISGLFHASGSSCINRFEFAVKLAEKFNYDKSLISPVTSKEKKQDAPRPVSTCLNSQKLESLIDFQFSSIDDGISFIFNKSN